MTPYIIPWLWKPDVQNRSHRAQIKVSSGLSRLFQLPAAAGLPELVLPPLPVLESVSQDSQLSISNVITLSFLPVSSTCSVL